MRFVSLAILLTLLGALPVSAAPIGATVIHRQGSASLFSTVAGRRLPLAVGDRVAEGDRIRTGDDGNVEIEFDTGSVIKIDRGTDLVVKALHRDEQGATFSIFGLLFGRVKSAVRKLVNPDSRFEYQTKAVVAGVAGTPPFVVSVTRAGVAEVDLLGTKGDKGAVFVRGFDAKKTLVTLTPGTGTTALIGRPPAAASPLGADRFRRLNQGLPFVARPKLNAAAEGKMTTDEALGAPPVEKKDEAVPEEEKAPDKKSEKKEETGAKGSEEKGADADDAAATGKAPANGAAPATPKEVARDMAVNGIQRVISVPVLTAPDKVNTASSMENNGTNDQGTIGQDAAAGGDSAPPLATKTITIRIDLK